MTRTKAPILLVVLLLSAGAVGAKTGELSFVGTQSSGDYGGETDADRQSTQVRFVMGDRTQLRLDLEVSRVRSGDGFTSTPLGPVPTRGRGPQGPGSGNPGGGGPSASGGRIGSEETTDPVPDDWVTGVGDARFAVSHRLAGGGAKVFRLDASLGFKAPTGDEADGLGTGEWDYRAGLAGEYRFWSATAFGGLGRNVLGDPEWIELADVFDAYLGIETEPLGGRAIVSGWLEGNEEVVPATGSRSALGVGVRTTGRLRLRAQMTVGLGGSAEDFSALVGVSFGVSTPVIGTRTLR